MNMYRCKTAVDLCLVGNNGRVNDQTIQKPKTAKHRERKAMVTRPRRPKTHLPITRAASILVR